MATEQDHAIRRAALVEVANREANEQVTPGPEAGWDVGLVERDCECGHVACAATVRLTVAEYEELRRDGRRFAILHEHLIPAAEHVVERTPRYTVVEKIAEAGEIAEELDPRA